MRIGCLQFAPRVGEFESNKSRAEAILARADPEDLQSLDLLVLPEMALSGKHVFYDFVAECACCMS